MLSRANIDDRPTDPHLWNISKSNGRDSATGHPIPFMFGSRVGFSGTADGTAPHYFRLNQIQIFGGWRPFWNFSKGHIRATHYPIHFIFVHNTDHTLPIKTCHFLGYNFCVSWQILILLVSWKQERIKILQETWELWSKIKWRVFLITHARCIS